MSPRVGGARRVDRAVARRRARWVVAAVLSIALAALAWRPVARHVVAATLLSRFEDPSASIDGVEVTDVELAGLRARHYTADDGPPVLLVHGVHPDGIDEPRLVRFAILLAGAGLTVVTPELPQLAGFHLDPASADHVASAARALATREGVGSVGVVGISFGGGLALIAAAEHPEVIHAVWAIGPQHDARRLARWWTDGPITGPEGRPHGAAAEKYGAQVLAYAWADEYFTEDAPRARRALRAVLENDPAAIRAHVAALSPTARAELARLRHGRPLGPAAERLRRIADAHADDLAAVSPAGRLADVEARVFLLHGADDPVIASTESRWIAAALPPGRLGGVVETALLRHADGDPLASWSTKWAVVRLTAAALESLAR